MFEYIDPVPIGAASLAQVHKATLKTGEVVAVKLQYPKLRCQYHLDMFIISRLVKASNWMCDIMGARSINFEEFLEHFAVGLSKELDFESEIINNDKTKSNFKLVDDLHVP